MDIKKIEGLGSFAKFFDFLNEPEKYSALIEEARQAVADYNDMLANVRKIKDIDVFRAEAAASADARNKELDDREVDLANRFKELEKAKADAQARADEQGRANAKRVDALNQREKALADLDKRQAAVEKAEAQLAEDKAAFSVAQEDFKIRLDKFNQLLQVS